MEKSYSIEGYDYFIQIISIDNGYIIIGYAYDLIDDGQYTFITKADLNGGISIPK